MKLRPLRGNSCVAFSVTVVIMAAESVRRAGAVASTLMVSLSAPAERWASSRARSPAERLKDAIWKPLKPGAVAESEYVLGLRSVKVNSPPEPDLSVRVACVLTSVSTTVALGITAPVASVTVPTTSAVVLCASMVVLVAAANRLAYDRLRSQFFVTGRMPVQRLVQGRLPFVWCSMSSLQIVVQLIDPVRRCFTTHARD